MSLREIHRYLRDLDQLEAQLERQHQTAASGGARALTVDEAIAQGVI